MSQMVFCLFFEGGLWSGPKATDKGGKGADSSDHYPRQAVPTSLCVQHLLSLSEGILTSEFLFPWIVCTDASDVE